jgi:hypothetical protein
MALAAELRIIVPDWRPEELEPPFSNAVGSSFAYGGNAHCVEVNSQSR